VIRLQAISCSNNVLEETNVKKKLRLVLLCLLFAAVVLGCHAPGGNSIDVKFEISQISGSPATAWVVYSDATSTAVTLNSVPLPWSYSFTDHKGDYVEVYSQGTNGDADTTVTIYENGSILMTATDHAWGTL
jgi:hypothetical protein